MADRRQHARAVLDEALQALLHAVERLGGLADVVRARIPGRRRHGLAAAEQFRGIGEPSQRARDRLRAENGDGRQDERRERRAISPIATVQNAFGIALA